MKEVLLFIILVLCTQLSHNTTPSMSTSPSNATQTNHTQKLTLIGCSRNVREGIRAFQYWSSVFIIPLTIFSNGLVVLGTFTHLRTNSANVYMFSLSLFDTVTIIGHKIYYFYSFYKIDLGSSFACKFIQYVMLVFHFSSIWTLVAMTLERVFVVYKPLQASVKCRPKVSVIVVATVFTFMLLIACSIFWEFDLVTLPSGPPRLCDIINLPLFQHMTWVRNTLQCFAPMTFLTLSNMAIIQRLSQQSRARSGLSTQNTERQTEKQRHITIMLLATSVTYVILTLPYAVKFILDAYWDFKKSCVDIIIYFTYNSIVYRLQDIIHCINGFIYIISSEKFRAEVLKRFRELPTGKFSRNQSSRMGSVKNSTTSTGSTTAKV